ncbi:MAG: hypothetical protein IPM82_21550 [Saprospiraceae bacterium]|nr:hypothetical protein [Saprospiraceae bacterium]
MSHKYKQFVFKTQIVFLKYSAFAFILNLLYENKITISWMHKHQIGSAKNVAEKDEPYFCWKRCVNYCSQIQENNQTKRRRVKPNGEPIINRSSKLTCKNQLSKRQTFGEGDASMNDLMAAENFVLDN